MLRRNSTRSKSDLQRRKSTCSVRSVHLEHIDATTAQRDAHRAAAHAFARGRERSSEAEMQNFPLQPPAPQREHCSENGVNRNNSVSSHNGDDNGQDLKRRQSVRFVRPQSSQSRTNHQAGNGEGESSKMPRSIYTPSIAQTNQSLRGHDTRSTGSFRFSMRGSSRSETQMSTRTSRPGFVHTLAETDVFYTPEDDIASMPSSYRRLRKTRSMFVPGRPAPAVAATATDRTQASGFLNIVSPNGIQGSPYSCSVGVHPGSSHKENRPISAAPILKATKSMSFLRHRREHVDSLSSRDGNIVLVRSPKPEFETFSRRSRLITKPSMFFKPKTSQLEPGMKKTLRRSSSGSALPLNITSASIPTIKDGTLKKTARKVSSSLKSRFKTLFSLHKGDDNATRIPEQQVKAQKTHVANFFDGRYYETGTYNGDVRHEEASLSQVSSHVPILHSVPQSELLHFRKGSVESIGNKVRKTSDDKSRVTSWTNSDSESLVSPHLHISVEECEKQRLSVIREIGMYTPSSPPQPQHPEETMAQHHDVAPSHVEGQLTNSSPVVNSDRVYSALMKRANETKQLADIVEQQRKSSCATSDPFRTTTSNTSTTESCDGRNSRAMLHPSQSATVGRKNCQNDTDDYGAIDPSNIIDQAVSTVNHPSTTVPSPTIRVVPRIKEPIREPHLAPVTLSHRSSAFFGSPECHFFRTKSPYRRALQGTMNSQEGDDQPNAEPSRSTTNSHHQLHHTDTFGSDVAGKPVYSESVYSERNADDRENSPHNALVAGNLTEPSSMLGDASVFVDVPAYRPTGSLGQTSPTGLIDWQAWLSTNASKLEPQVSPPYARDGRATEVEYTLPSMPKAFGHGHGPGHVRESAQIDDQEDMETDPVIPPGMLVTMPNAPFGLVEPNIVQLSPRYRSSVKKNLASPSILQENAAPSSFESPRRLPPVPSTPAVYLKSPLGPLPAQSLKSTKSARDLRTIKPGSPQTPDHTTSTAARRTKSLARLRSLHKIRTTNLGSPFAPSASATVTSRANSARTDAVPGSIHSSPLLSEAMLRQFGPDSQQDTAGVAINNEMDLAQADRSGHNGIQSPGDQDGNPETQGPSSKQMVEDFLNSRRRRMTSEDESLAFV